jgi:hypothetical protein
MKADNGRQSIVIIGNGMVGHKFVESLVERGAHERFTITVFQRPHGAGPVPGEGGLLPRARHSDAYRRRGERHRPRG